MFNVIIIGGENIPDYGIFQKECAYYLRDKAKSGERIRILTVGDTYIDKFASTFGIETKTFICDWRKYGTSALAVRNKDMIEEADAIIYFDSNKKDLDNLFDYVTKSGIPFRRKEISQLVNQ